MMCMSCVFFGTVQYCIYGIVLVDVATIRDSVQSSGRRAETGRPRRGLRRPSPSATAPAARRHRRRQWKLPLGQREKL